MTSPVAQPEEQFSSGGLATVTRQGPRLLSTCVHEVAVSGKWAFITESVTGCLSAKVFTRSSLIEWCSDDGSLSEKPFGVY